MIGQGATTLWETWRESDNTYSNCHPMFGSVSEWFYRWLGGIRPDHSYPGFQKFHLEPHTPDGLLYVKTSCKTPYGYIVSDWKKNESREIVYQITVPKGTTAMFRIPVHEYDQVDIASGQNTIQTDRSDFREGTFQKSLSGGEYVITRKMK